MKIFLMKNKRRNKNKSNMYPFPPGSVLNNQGKVQIVTDNGIVTLDNRPSPAHLVAYEPDRKSAARYASEFLVGINHAIDETKPQGFAIWVLE